MARLKIFGAIAGLAMLSGCLGYDIENMRTVEGSGDACSRALTEEYRQITLFEADEMYDWSDASYFARKGLLAASGERVAPEAVEDWDLPADKVDELASARARLVGLLDQGACDQFPELAGHAQGRFDCWIEQQEENHQPDHIAACRDEFYAALAELEAAMQPPAPEPPAMVDPEPFVVFFAFDSAILSAEAEDVVDAAVAAARKMGATEFSVTGHTDTAGSEAYNSRLSIRRANAVKDALVARGVGDADVSVAGRGEGELAIPTPDGTPEAANRRVVIIIQ